MSVYVTAFAGAGLLAMAAFGQTSANGPRFEAASIKPSTVEVVRPGSARVDSSRVELLGQSLAQLIRTAYRLETYQSVTLPDGMRRASFDVVATLPAGASKAQIPEMLQALLADELKLVVRKDIREQPVCVLSVAKNGPKLKAVAADATTDMVIPHTDNRTAVSRQRIPEGFVTYSRLNGTVILDAPKISLPDLAILLRREVNLPVFDRTGLPGFYEVSLFVPAPWLRSGVGKAASDDSFGSSAGDAANVPMAVEPEGVNLFRSIGRLGLKLEKSHAPIEHLVVESAEAVPVVRNFP
jgi:uncharacterized protein (TIGR03435 family)